MAVRGIATRITRLPASSIGLGLAAVGAAALSLAAALVGLTGGSSSTQLAGFDELAARNERVAFFEARAQADSIDFVSLNILAWEYLQRARETGDVGDYERAEFAASRSLAILPQDNYNATLALAAVKLVQHDFTAALALSEAAIELKPGGAAAYGSKSDALIGRGRYEEAGRVLQKMVALEPTLPALSRLAGFAFLEGDNLNAADFWRQAIDRAAGLPLENLAWARAQLGGLYFGRGELEKAEKQFSAALKTYPDYVHAVAGLASVRAAQARWDESIRLYESAQARLPQPQYVIALGDVYARAGRTAEAESQYQLIEAIDRLYKAKGINTDLQLALFYANHDRSIDRALLLAENAYSASAGVYAADAYAWALFKAGRYLEADAKISEALRMNTPDASFYFHAGMIRYGLGDNAGAAAYLEKALRLNPHFSLLHADLARDTLAKAKGGR